MTQDSLTLYKLIVLYMLSRVDFPLTKAQVSDFILEKEYTTFLTLQQAINELTDADLISAKQNRNRTHLSITEEGRKTLSFFENQIHHSIKEDINEFLHTNKLEMRNEVSILADYNRAASGGYEAHMKATERNATLVEITLSVPDEETASSVCINWQKYNQEVYQYLIGRLF